MGFGKERNKIRALIPKWNCFGKFGYGQGRAYEAFGEKPLKNKSTCIDLCPRSAECRAAHHAIMDARYPDLANIVTLAARIARNNGKDVARTVMAAVKLAEGNGVAGIAEIRRINETFKLDTATDHYICGQFENIQNGIEKKPASYVRPIPPAPVEMKNEEGTEQNHPTERSAG